MLGAGAFQLLNGKFTEGGTAETIYIPVPVRCRVRKIQAAIEAATGTNPTVLTAKIGGTAVTGGVVTLPVASSAASRAMPMLTPMRKHQRCRCCRR